MLKKALLYCGVATAGLIGVLVVRTLVLGKGPEVAAVELPRAPSFSAEEVARHLGEAIRFRTITTNAGDPQPGQEQPWLDLHSWLEARYPKMHAATTMDTVDGYSRLYRWQGSDSEQLPIMLMAHQDVVPVNPGTESDWAAPPFAGEIIDGYVYGRGALDNKSNMVAIAEAVEALLHEGFEPRRTVYILFGHDEEIVYDTGAEFAFDLLRERGVRLALVLDEGSGVIKPSPMGGPAMGGINVAEKGWISLQLTATAEGGHSSAPPRNSATVRLARAVAALDDNQMPADLEVAPLPDTLATLAADMPFAQRLVMSNLWLFSGVVEMLFSSDRGMNATIRTTTAPTMLEGSAKENVLAQRATAVVNFRIHPSNTSADVIAHVQAITGEIGGIEVETIGEIYEPTPVSSTDYLGYRVLHSIATELADGGPVAPMLQVGATDSRHAFGVADNVYRFTPSIGSMDDFSGVHGTNERISVANMGSMPARYAQIILAMDDSD
ncbi:MAG: M20 family peptidase [Pseudomonadota bacterium]